MWFVAIGVLMLVMNFAGLGPVGHGPGVIDGGRFGTVPGGRHLVGVCGFDRLDAAQGHGKVDNKRKARRQKHLEDPGWMKVSRPSQPGLTENLTAKRGRDGLRIKSTLSSEAWSPFMPQYRSRTSTAGRNMAVLVPCGVPPA